LTAVPQPKLWQPVILLVAYRLARPGPVAASRIANAASGAASPAARPAQRRD